MATREPGPEPPRVRQCRRRPGRATRAGLVTLKDMTLEAQVETAQPPIRWGILGAGRIARSFVADLLLLKDQVPAAVGSRSSGRAQHFAADFGIESYYGSYAALAADDSLDVIYVATPHSEHFDGARLCLEAGRPVLVEKPFTATAAEPSQLLALATRRRLLPVR